MEIAQIIKKIFEQQDEILSNLNFESIDVYLFLKNEYEKGNILNNFVFQFVFRSYYRLDSAGLSDKIKKHYFELLAGKQTKLERILSELYEIPTLRSNNTIQFSFATKLLHTIDNNFPIFDSEVGKIFNMGVIGVGRDAKIASCIKIYDSLKIYYTELKKEEKIKEVISKFRQKFNVDTEKVSDTKILDFIIWSLGKLELKK
ncbi:hypothetical protein KKC83_01555 [Patescibacteria group bacterium]|nr:hypothetical protein [Candidatus Falkowbacteria bacterium]MBU4014745.1 hypothetical protein [Patescibacteria group bacterium]MBU4026211.1 hypothetical protein [Patescibacteria group bacterium]MBU4072712.1 hypothetical protein [Patescibacteria group bacterium]MBU4124863.1 hypothetical protein [Patescibacteria group bacterium]